MSWAENKITMDMFLKKIQEAKCIHTHKTNPVTTSVTKEQTTESGVFAYAEIMTVEYHGNSQRKLEVSDALDKYDSITNLSKVEFNIRINNPKYCKTNAGSFNQTYDIWLDKPNFECGPYGFQGLKTDLVQDVSSAGNVIKVFTDPKIETSPAFYIYINLEAIPAMEDYSTECKVYDEVGNLVDHFFSMVSFTNTLAQVALSMKIDADGYTANNTYVYKAGKTFGYNYGFVEDDNNLKRIEDAWPWLKKVKPFVIDTGSSLKAFSVNARYQQSDITTYRWDSSTIPTAAHSSSDTLGDNQNIMIWIPRIFSAYIPLDSGLETGNYQYAALFTDSEVLAKAFNSTLDKNPSHLSKCENFINTTTLEGFVDYGFNGEDGVWIPKNYVSGGYANSNQNISKPGTTPIPPRIPMVNYSPLLQLANSITPLLADGEVQYMPFCGPIIGVLRDISALLRGHQTVYSNAYASWGDGIPYMAAGNDEIHINPLDYSATKQTGWGFTSGYRNSLQTHVDISSSPTGVAYYPRDLYSFDTTDEGIKAELYSAQQDFFSNVLGGRNLAIPDPTLIGCYNGNKQCDLYYLKDMAQIPEMLNTAYANIYVQTWYGQVYASKYTQIKGIDGQPLSIYDANETHSNCPTAYKQDMMFFLPGYGMVALPSKSPNSGEEGLLCTDSPMELKLTNTSIIMGPGSPEDSLQSIGESNPGTPTVLIGRLGSSYNYFANVYSLDADFNTAFNYIDSNDKSTYTQYQTLNNYNTNYLFGKGLPSSASMNPFGIAVMAFGSSPYSS